MNDTKSSGQTNLYTATNFIDYQIKTVEQPYSFKDNQVGDNLSSVAIETGSDKTNCPLTPLDSENDFLPGNQDTKCTSFGIKQFWYTVQG